MNHCDVRCKASIPHRYSSLNMQVNDFESRCINFSVSGSVCGHLLHVAVQKCHFVVNCAPMLLLLSHALCHVSSGWIRTMKLCVQLGASGIYV